MPEPINAPYSKESVKKAYAEALKGNAMPGGININQDYDEFAANQIREANEYVKKLEAFKDSATTLDPNDPFDKVVIDMVNMNRKKRRDYAADSDPFSNFRDTARNMALDGFGPAEATYTLLLTKVSRLRSLRANGRMEDTANESVLDTYLDLAVYAVILLALVKEQANGTQQSER